MLEEVEGDVPVAPEEAEDMEEQSLTKMMEEDDDEMPVRKNGMPMPTHQTGLVNEKEQYNGKEADVAWDAWNVGSKGAYAPL